MDKKLPITPFGEFVLIELDEDTGDSGVVVSVGCDVSQLYNEILNKTVQFDDSNISKEYTADMSTEELASFEPVDDNDNAYLDPSKYVLVNIRFIYGILTKK